MSSDDDGHTEKRIRPPRPKTANRASSDATWTETLDEPNKQAPPHPPALHFGVSGEGKSKRIFAFESMSSAVLSEEGPTSWFCEECNYENADILSRSCSMCGTKRMSRGFSFSRREGSEAKRGQMATVSERSDRSLRRLSLNDTTGWACPDCTFVNSDPHHLTCDVCGREKPTKRGSHSEQSSISNFLSDSMKNGMLAGSFMDHQVKEFLQFEQMAIEKDRMASLVDEQKAILTAAKRRTNAGEVAQNDYTELKGILEEGEETLKALKSFYAEEKKEYDAMVLLQEAREKEIETQEGVSPKEALTGGATKPGVQRISAQVLEWHGQQRMLDDWKAQLNEREKEISQLQIQQKEALERLLG